MASPLQTASHRLMEHPSGYPPRVIILLYVALADFSFALRQFCSAMQLLQAFSTIQARLLTFNLSPTMFEP